jgi:hypothetical protein
MPEDTTSPALPDGSDVISAGGQEAVSTASDAQQAGIRDIMSQITGKNFPTDEAAAKSLKDTYAFVGGAGMKAQKLMNDLKVKLQKDESGVLNLMENLATNPNPYQAPANASDLTVFNEIAGLKKQVEESSFYDERPELKEYRSIIGDLRDQTGKPIREVVELPAVKILVEKARSFDTAERSRSVLHSNPKLGQVRDKISEAREAAGRGDTNAANKSAVSAVLDSFDMS